MALTGLSPSSTSRATLARASRSFFETSPLRSVWMTRSWLLAVGRAELCRVLDAEVVADIVGLGGAVEHDEEDRLLPERLELVSVLPPALDAGREIALVLDAGDVGRLPRRCPAVMPFIGCLTTLSMIACLSG